jgi:hypothetical protein
MLQTAAATFDSADTGTIVRKQRKRQFLSLEDAEAQRTA